MAIRTAFGVNGNGEPAEVQAGDIVSLDNVFAMDYSTNGWGGSSGTTDSTFATYYTKKNMSDAANDNVQQAFIVPPSFYQAPATNQALMLDFGFVSDGSAAGDCRLELQCHLVRSGVIYAASADYTVLFTITMSATADVVVRNTVNITNSQLSFVEYDAIALKLTRLGTDPADTYTGELGFIGADLTWTPKYDYI